jgi:hypothetical protein
MSPVYDITLLFAATHKRARIGTCVNILIFLFRLTVLWDQLGFSKSDSRARGGPDHRHLGPRTGLTYRVRAPCVSTFWTPEQCLAIESLSKPDAFLTRARPILFGYFK